MPRRRFWKIAEIAATIIAVASFTAGWGLWMRFAYTRPTAASSDRLYALDTHGWRVYLTTGEHFTLTSLFVLFVVGSAIAVTIDRGKRPFDSN